MTEPTQDATTAQEALVVVLCVSCGREVWGAQGEAGRVWETDQPRPALEPESGYCAACLQALLDEHRPLTG